MGYSLEYHPEMGGSVTGQGIHSLNGCVIIMECSCGYLKRGRRCTVIPTGGLMKFIQSGLVYGTIGDGTNLYVDLVKAVTLLQQIR